VSTWFPPLFAAKSPQASERISLQKPYRQSPIIKRDGKRVKEVSGSETENIFPCPALDTD
jgi:hypothetical protein